MLGHDFFYRSLIRNYVVAFGTLFSNIIIKDWDATNNAWTDVVRVPISYGSKEKHLARVSTREFTNEAAAITLPRIGFVITGIMYDTSRVINKMNRITRVNDSYPASKEVLRPPIPYDINFELSVITKKTEDATKIVEQILPFFAPNMNIALRIKYGNKNDTSDDVIIIDVPVILNSVTPTEDFEGDFETRRAITWIFDFTMKAKFFGAVSMGDIIKKTITNISTNNNVNSFEDSKETITIIPIIDGKEWEEITADDDYGYDITITNYE